MKSDSFPVDALRERALERLGSYGDALARDALEAATILVEENVLRWEGSHGSVGGHRVTLLLPPALHARVLRHHATLDALSEVLSAAMAERDGHVLADLRFGILPDGGAALPRSRPYRDRG